MIEKIIKILAVIDAVLLLFIIAMAIQADAEYVTSECGLCIRAAPSASGGLVRVAGFAEEIYGEIEAGWMRLEDGSGYACADYVSVHNPLDNMELLGTWRVTAYAETGYPCANGHYPEAGYTIACNSLPFGTVVYIEDVGFRTVEDRGPAWLGSEWCDLYLGYHWDCVQWGNRYLKVWRVRDAETN